MYAFISKIARVAALASLIALTAEGAVAGPYPKFEGRVGAYGVQTPEQIQDMASNGFKLALVNFATGRGKLAEAMRKNGVYYIDPYIWAQIRNLCNSQLRSEGRCDEGQQDKVVASVHSYLAQNGNNPSVIGYWILDDYPGGDIRDLLRRLHDEVASSNAQIKQAKPAICGFGGRILTSEDSLLERVRMKSKGFAKAIVNFDPQACDMVALYPYSVTRSNDPSTTDWSMSGTLPAMLTELRKHGWVQEREPLIGMPQAFGGPQRHGSTRFHPLPRAADLERLAEAYCKAGAVALLAYSWDDGKHDKTTELYDSPDLVDGLRRGKAKCQRYWK